MFSVAFWQDVVSGGGGGGDPDPVDQFYIAWDADQITGESGRFSIPMPPGTPASATGLWADSDASAVEPVQEIYFTVDLALELGVALTTDNVTSLVVQGTIPDFVPRFGTIRMLDDDGEYRVLQYSSYSGSTFTITTTDGNEDFATVNASIGNKVLVIGRRIEVSNHSSFEATAGTWGLTHSQFTLGDDARTIISYITDFNDTQAVASVLLLLDHQDPLQSLDIGSHPHPNYRNFDTDLHWELTTELATPKPAWSLDDKDTQVELTTTGYGGHVKVGPSFLAPVCRLIATTANGYAGKACEPRFSVAVPAGLTLNFQVTRVFANGSPNSVTNHSFDGEINWTGRPDEINITLPKVELDAGDKLLIKLWVDGLANGFDTESYALWQYSDHRIVERGADVPFSDTKAIFIDPVNGNDQTAQFGNVNRPYRSYIAFARDTTQNAFPVGTKEDPINVYQPRGTVAEWAEGGTVPTGDACYLKDNVFHLQPWPGTNGQAPVICGHATWPRLTDNPPGTNNYGRAQDGLITLRNCSDSIVEDFIVEDSRHVGIVVEIRQERDRLIGSVSDGNVLRNCLVKRAGADGVLIRGGKYSGSSTSHPAWQSGTEFSNFPVTNTYAENIRIYEANWAMVAVPDNLAGHPDATSPATGQAFTLTHAVGATVINCRAEDYRKEGFDVISSRNVSFIDCYARRKSDSVYGQSRGTAFYNDSQAEGNRDILFDRCICEGDATGAVLGSERGGECTRIVFRNMWISGVNAGINIAVSEGGETATYTDCVIEHCTIVAGTSGGVDYFVMSFTNAGDPTGVTFRNNILVANRTNLLNSSKPAGPTQWPIFEDNVLWSTAGSLTGYVPAGTINVDPQFVSATDLRPQNAAVLGQITPPIRTANVFNEAVPDPDNFGGY